MSPMTVCAQGMNAMGTSGDGAQGCAHISSGLHTSASSEEVLDTDPATDAAQSATIWCRSAAQETECARASAPSFTAAFSALMVWK